MANKKKTTKKPRTKKKPAQKQVKSKAVIIAISVVLVLALVISAVTVVGSRVRRTNRIKKYEFTDAVANGIDVSEHNGEIDWQALSDEIDFAFIRLGYRGYVAGNINEDIKADDNMEGCEEAGIPYGVYFYSQAVNEKEAEEEAEFLIKKLRHRNPSLPIVIDFEYAIGEDGGLTGRLYDSNLSANEATDMVNAFCKKVESAGYTSGIYASSSVLAHKLNQKKLGDDTVVWIADYNATILYKVDYDIWQYSKTGELDAVSSKYVDLNYWYEP